MYLDPQDAPRTELYRVCQVYDPILAVFSLPYFVKRLVKMIRHPVATVTSLCFPLSHDMPPRLLR